MHLERLRDIYSAFELVYFHSNHEEGDIDYLQTEEVMSSQGVVLNLVYTAYSIAIADAVRALVVPVVEVHISNLATREPLGTPRC